MHLSSSGEGATIDAGGRSRLFTLLAGAALELSGVNCSNGRATTLSTTFHLSPAGANGGAIYAGGGSNVTLIGVFVSNCTVDGSVAYSEPAGGAIFLLQSAVLLSNSTFDGCAVTASGGFRHDAVRAALAPATHREGSRWGRRVG